MTKPKSILLIALSLALVLQKYWKVTATESRGVVEGVELNKSQNRSEREKILSFKHEKNYFVTISGKWALSYNIPSNFG